MSQNEAKSSKKVVLRKRKKTLKKKAEELSILCGVPVCLVCYDPDGKLETWPEDKNKVDHILKEYINKIPAETSKLSNKDSSSKNENQEKNIPKLEKKKKVFNTWDSRLDYLHEDSLTEFLMALEGKAKTLEERMSLEKIEKVYKRTQINDDDDDDRTSTSIHCSLEESGHDSDSDSDSDSDVEEEPSNSKHP